MDAACGEGKSLTVKADDGGCIHGSGSLVPHSQPCFTQPISSSSCRLPPPSLPLSTDINASVSTPPGSFFGGRSLQFWGHSRSFPAADAYAESSGLEASPDAAPSCYISQPHTTSLTCCKCWTAVCARPHFSVAAPKVRDGFRRSLLRQQNLTLKCFTPFKNYISFLYKLTVSCELTYFCDCFYQAR